MTWHHGMFGYWRANGSFMPLIAGGAEDGEDETQGEAGEEQEEEADEGEDDGSEGAGETVESLKAEIAALKADRVSEEDYASITNPAKKMAAMQNHINRLHKKNVQQERFIERMETMSHDVTDEGEALKAARIEASFLWTAIASGESFDLETAWDLAQVKGFTDLVKVSDKGEVEGMEKTLETVLQRYPFLVDTPPMDEDDGHGIGRTAPAPKKRSGNGNGELSQASLVERFPALARRR